MKKLLGFSVLLLGACQLNQPEPYMWAGRWYGPEGTYLELTQREAVDTAPASYDIIIRDLDKEHHYKGQANGNMITFNRDGVPEKISRGTGQETGMKWLADKNHCLVIKSGEGYCRS